MVMGRDGYMITDLFIFERLISASWVLGFILKFSTFAQQKRNTWRGNSGVTLSCSLREDSMIVLSWTATEPQLGYTRKNNDH